MIKEFFNDIWRETSLVPLAYPSEKELIQKYENNFDFSSAIEVINDFLIMKKYNVNFELYKKRMLIILKECYER